MPRTPHARRRTTLVAATLLFAGALAVSANPGPDVTVFSLGDISRNGTLNGVVGYSIGTTSCNIGTIPVNWCDNAGGCSGLDDRQHPVIAQNIYRLKNGRFEQIGMSWLKHGFVSTNSPSAGCTGHTGQGCTQPPRGGNELGVGCIDTYGSGLNGSRPLGMRSEVNPQTGFFPFPETFVSSSGVDQWAQVDVDDLDPALNAGATYWAEGQYISDNDALAGNGFNNASYRPVAFGASPYNPTFTGPTVRERFAIQRWPLSDATVALMNVDYFSKIAQRFQVARKVTQPTAGVWHYEIAVHNVNVDLAAGGFTVDFPGAATITNVGFHDIEHHSGEPFATTDWTATVDNANGRVTWRSETFAQNPNANALRWGTMFSFWFDVNVGAAPRAEIELFKPDPANDAGALSFSFPPNATLGAQGAARRSDRGLQVPVTVVRRSLGSLAGK
jgi:hypothetical protein